METEDTGVIKETSINPWLSISYKDYDKHMKASSVFQSQTLSKIFKNSLQQLKPETILILGCGGGNGFKHIDDSVTKVVTGVDINQKFLDICEARYKDKKFELNLSCCDFDIENNLIETADFISCALFLEYVDVEKALRNIKRIMESRSRLNIVIQRSNNNKFVSSTSTKSLENLSGIANEISETDLRNYLDKIELFVENKEVYNLPNGKEFIPYSCYKDC